MIATDDAVREQTRPDLFELSSRADGARGVIRAHGELDVATVPTVEEAARALWADGADAVELDLGAVTFFDSSGLQLLTRLTAFAEESAQRSFKLTDCSEPVRRVLELTRLADRFGV